MARWRLCSCAVLNTMYSPSNCSFFNRKKRLRKIVWDIDTQIHFGCTNLSDNSIMFAIFKYWLSFYVAREKKKKITPWKKQSCLWTEMTQFSVYTGSWKWWQSVWHRFFFSDIQLLIFYVIETNEMVKLVLLQYFLFVSFS